MKLKDEKGVAIILAMLMLAVLSVIAASLMSVAAAETAGSSNYREMTLGRYGGESAIHKAANFLMGAYYAGKAPNSGTDPLTNYTLSATSLTYNGNPVVLSWDSTRSNYPVTEVVTAFQQLFSGANGRLDGSTVVTYRAEATLVAMRKVILFGGTTGIVQTWRIVGTGILPRSHAEVEVSSVLERQVQPAFRYAAFAVDTGCKALWWTGSGYVDSYDSADNQNPPVTVPSGGNVGTNGNLTVANHSTINGSLSVPPTGVCQCPGGVLTGTVTGGAPIRLPQAVTYPTPDPPAPMPGTGNLNTFGTIAPTLDENGNLVGPTYPDVRVGAGKTLTLQPGTYNMNSLRLDGGAIMTLSGTGNVIIHLAGQGFTDGQSVLDIAGNTISTGNYDPSRLQIIYGGTATVGLSGSGETSALLYAPNATVNMNAAGGHWYGAVIGKTIKDASAGLHYDRSLQRKMLTLGAFMLDSFTWKKF